jgi:hypothetical protein
VPTFYRPAKVVVTEGSGIGGAALAVGGLVLGVAAVVALVRFALRVLGDVAPFLVLAEGLAALVLIGGVVVALTAPARAQRRAVRARRAAVELAPAEVIRLDGGKVVYLPNARRELVGGEGHTALPAARTEMPDYAAIPRVGPRPGVTRLGRPNLGGRR